MIDYLENNIQIIDTGAPSLVLTMIARDLFFSCMCFADIYKTCQLGMRSLKNSEQCGGGIKAMKNPTIAIA